MKQIFRISFFCLVIANNLLAANFSVANQGMVTSAHPLASEAGLEILKKGGNAADATVAILFALSVVEPYSAGIGGGGFLLFYDNKNKTIRSLDFRERAPKKAHSKMYFNEKNQHQARLSLDGHLAVAVPHTVQGMVEFHKKHGSMKFKKLLKRAIKFAENGIVVDQRLHKKIGFRLSELLKHEDSKKLFTKNGAALPIGSKLVQKDLAKTLKRIAKNPSDFYQGKIAKKIVQEMQKHKGIISLDDLKNRKVTWRDPVCQNFLGARICSMGPPSSGGIVLHQSLKILEKLKYASEPWQSTKSLHAYVEALKLSYADRAHFLGDPDFVTIPQEKLLSDQYISEKIKQINLTKATPSLKIKNLPEKSKTNLVNHYESSQTTHFNVVDQWNNAVALTFTINGNFGSGVVAKDTGILLNNEMDDFSTAPGVPNLYGLVGGVANQVEARKIPLSSMTPTIALKNNQLLFCAGSPGGSTIITTVLQITLRLLAHKMSAKDAVNLGKVHMQWMPDQIFYEKFSIGDQSVKALTKMGHNLIERDYNWGNASVILRKDNLLHGAVDKRGIGAAFGILANVEKK